MTGRGYAIFDTAVGRCGIVWSDAGVVAVQLPEARELETRRRLFRLYPEAREMRPSRSPAAWRWSSRSVFGWLESAGPR